MEIIIQDDLNYILNYLFNLQEHTPTWNDDSFFLIFKKMTKKYRTNFLSSIRFKKKKYNSMKIF